MSARSRIALHLEPTAASLLERLEAILASQSIDAYLVGGSLRDAFLDRALSDIDVAVTDEEEHIARRLADELDGHFVPLDPERGIARVALDEGPVRYIDVVRLRGDLRSDLGERDFTIDAMAAPLGPVARGEAVDATDPFGGRVDLERRTVRSVSDGAFLSDPLRLLRAVRLCAELDFELEAGTTALVRRHAALIAGSSAERQRDELARILSTERAACALRLLDELGLLEILLPEVTAGRGVSQPKEH
jgi:tRNA nucleotidyltransferase/poly(A) polymerase